MIHHITLTGRSIALACDGTVTTQHGAGGATGAVYVEASHLTLLHDMRDGEFYRTGQNSWSPSGWRRLSEAPMRASNGRYTLDLVSVARPRSRGRGAP